MEELGVPLSMGELCAGQQGVYLGSEDDVVGILFDLPSSARPP